MTDLEAISEAPVPRPDRLAQRFARRIEPTWGFFLYGILYFAVVANTVGVLPLMVMVATQPKPAPSWMPVAWAAWYVVAQIASWWVFWRWIKSRRAHGVTLVRDGELVTGDVDGSAVSVSGVRLGTAIDFGRERQCKVLFLAGARWCFVFDPGGSAVACGIGRGDPLGPLGRESNVDPLPEARIVE